MGEIFSTKANTLEYLKPKLKKSIIENLYSFTVLDWKKNKNKIVEDISKIFSSPVIVRSSAVGEDSFESSNAGNFESIHNVSPKIKTKLSKAINDVILSYSKKKSSNDKNQILIQNQTKKVITSGVIFSRANEYGSPYYVINYEDGGSTVGVTQGKINNVLKIHRSFRSKNIPKKWYNLLQSVKEIEKVSNSSTLDIEFGLKKIGKPIIFQVRHLTYIKKSNFNYLDSKLSTLLIKNQKLFQKFSEPHISQIGKNTIFSDMTDWNPSEIIGSNPNNLDYSLYDYLIMNDSWHKGRQVLGYTKLQNSKLMRKFGNKPYVDVRASFNSLIPEKIDDKTKKKLLAYYFDILKTNPELHDKVEFKILFTCYDFSIEKRLRKLSKYGFTNNEIQKLKSFLESFTHEIIKKFSHFESDCNKDLDLMIINRKKINDNLQKSNEPFELLVGAKKLLDDCKKYGTTQFSTMARIGFIGTILLESLVEKKIISNIQQNLFLESIHSPVYSLRTDLKKFSKKQISKHDLLRKYGHLRPGTYDITATRYDKNPSFLENLEFLKTSKTKIKLSEPDISKILYKHNIEIESSDFFSFVRKAIASREFVKFEFTKNLSDAIEYIAKAADLLGFSRHEISNLDLKTIFTFKNYNKKKYKDNLDKKIIFNQKQKILQTQLQFPSIIFTKNDLEVFSYFSSIPNYISKKKIKKDSILLEKNISSTNIANKIVIIENADPGFDWIFTKGIAGLITKYGGVASHMAIRCSELGIPAAIGCGELIYEKLFFSKHLLLDCENKQIVILQTRKNDEYIEEKKVLKSLGYIK